MTSYYHIKHQLQHLQIQAYNQTSAHTSYPCIADTTPFHKINADRIGIAIVVYLDSTWRWDYKLILYQTLVICHWTHTNTSKVTYMLIVQSQHNTVSYIQSRSTQIRDCHCSVFRQDMRLRLTPCTSSNTNESTFKFKHTPIQTHVLLVHDRHDIIAWRSMEVHHCHCKMCNHVFAQHVKVRLRTHAYCIEHFKF